MSKIFNKKYVPWHGILYTTIGAEIGHGLLTSIASYVYNNNPNPKYENANIFSNPGLKPYVRSSSIASSSTINFGSPFYY